MSMLLDQSPAEAFSFEGAKRRVCLGPVPPWVTLNGFDADFKSSSGEALSYLLIDRQLHAETHQTYVRTVARLESMQAVQHESQWRLPFEPSTQFITLHWIKIRRGDAEINHTNLERFRILQREEGLERFIIDGWFTLLLVLEDVRAGDILESCYTLETQPKLLPEHCTHLFALPQGAPIGRFSFSVQFRESRPLKWKSCTPDQKPVESCHDREVKWTWTGERLLIPKPETNTPGWHITYPWIQISDCPDWATISRAVAKAWEAEVEGSTFKDVLAEVVAHERDLLQRVERAIQLVQDQHRYLSVDLETGGHVPSPPEIVLRRRYGDCKDLSLLLVRFLQGLGIPARPILVNTALRRTVAEMLPMPSLFDHAVVEFQLDGQTRCVDPTIKRQGGGPLNRVVPAYDIGLPVDSAASALIEIPKSTADSLYELKETVLLDTTGTPSLLAVIVRTKGQDADLLRQYIETAGLEEVAKERLQMCMRRFVDAKRLDKIDYRDNRPANEVLLAEVFEIKGFLLPHEERSVCRFPTPATLPASVLQIPEPGRRTSFGLPYPCHIAHTFEVESPVLQPMAGPRFDLETPFLRFSRREKSLHRYWSVTFSLTTLVDAVAPERFGAYTKAVEQVWRESIGGLLVPVGAPRPRRRSDFGQLPDNPMTELNSVSSPGLSQQRGAKPAEQDSKEDQRPDENLARFFERQGPAHVRKRPSMSMRLKRFLFPGTLDRMRYVLRWTACVFICLSLLFLLVIANRDKSVGAPSDGPLIYGIPIIGTAVVVHIYFLAFALVPRLRDGNISAWASAVFLVPVFGWLIAFLAVIAPSGHGIVRNVKRR